MPKIAAQYLRVSTEAQSDENKYGLDLQRSACESYAKDNDLDIQHTFIDVASGQSADRTGIQEALTKARAAEFTDFIVLDATRIGRTRQVSTNIRAGFENANVRIHYASSGTYTDPESEDGILLEALGDAMSEIEIKKFVRRSRGGKRRAAAAGNVVIGGKIPFGYKRDQTGKKLIKDPTEAKHVRWMFESFNKGKSLHWIAKQLEQRKIPTAFNKSWTPSTVMKMLRREHYIGSWFFGKTRTVKGKKIPQPREDWIEVPIPAIISKTEWNSAQKQLTINARKSAKNTKHTYLVRGRISCADCGRNYRGRAKTYKGAKKTTSYFYYKHAPEKNACTNNNLWLRRDKVEGDVKAELLGWLKNPNHKWEIYIEEQSLTAESLQAEVDKALRKLKKLDEDFKRARQFLVEGTLSRDDFEAESRRIGNQKDTLEKKETELRDLMRPDYYVELGEQAADHELRNFWKDIKENEISSDEWFTYIDTFDVKISVLPLNKKGKRRFRITSTVGKKTVTAVK